MFTNRCVIHTSNDLDQFASNDRLRVLLVESSNRIGIPKTMLDLYESFDRPDHGNIRDADIDIDIPVGFGCREW